MHAGRVFTEAAERCYQVRGEGAPLLGGGRFSMMSAKSMLRDSALGGIS